MDHHLQHVSRRDFLRGLGLGTGAAARRVQRGAHPTCAGRTATSSATSPAATAAGDQPKSGGTLKIGRSDDITTLDGMFFQSNTLGTTYGTVYERLVDYDNQLQAQPMLAEAWEFSSDFKQLKLSLRKGVTWHSGRDFTSADVKWNLQRIGDKKVANGQWYLFAAWFQAIDTSGTEHGDPAYGPATSRRTGPVRTAQHGRFRIVEAPAATTSAVGTGPFTFVNWKQGDSISFARNKNYWQTGRPYLDAVEVDISNDPALVVRLEGGGMQAISDPPIQDLLRLKQDPSWGILNTNPGYYTLGVNTDPPGANPLLQDKRVRQALNMAVDRRRFTGTVLGGLSEPWNLPWPSYSEAYEPAKQAVTTFDLDKAKSLLSSAGVTSAEVEVVYRSTDGELAQFVQCTRRTWPRLE